VPFGTRPSLGLFLVAASKSPRNDRSARQHGKGPCKLTTSRPSIHELPSIKGVYAAQAEPDDRSSRSERKNYSRIGAGLIQSVIFEAEHGYGRPGVAPICAAPGRMTRLCGAARRVA
jgi:hypothetical protein